MHVSESYSFNYINVKNPAFAQQKNSSNAKGFLWRTIPRKGNFDPG